eukprot:6012070-Prymnesium_polylepis.1
MVPSKRRRRQVHVLAGPLAHQRRAQHRRELRPVVRVGRRRQRVPRRVQQALAGRHIRVVDLGLGHVEDLKPEPFDRAAPVGRARVGASSLDGREPQQQRVQPRRLRQHLRAADEEGGAARPPDAVWPQGLAAHQLGGDKRPDRR